MLQEIKLDYQQAEFFGVGLGNQYSGNEQVVVLAEGDSGGLLIVWKPTMVQIEGVSSNRNWLVVKVKHLSTNVPFLLVNVYGLSSSTSKSALWSDLDGVISKNDNHHLFIRGDFNAIISVKDKREGITRLGRSQQNFND
ncbi:hypothetical protein SUGI_0425330 [Cryptomeria japonica]|nr:hypothetical protein SUGI_0425330 [Cryptomeria japonica]